MANDKVVLRFNSGELLKGYLKEFTTGSHSVLFEELGDGTVRTIPVEKLKAIFFVKTFAGESGRRERKKYGISHREGRKIFVRFKDGESMAGYFQGKIPWDRGFFLSKPNNKKTGFFIMPADGESNNIKVFVISSSVRDITTL